MIINKWVYLLAQSLIFYGVLGVGGGGYEVDILDQMVHDLDI